MERPIRKWRINELSERSIVVIVLLVLTVVAILAALAQTLAERNAYTMQSIIPQPLEPIKTNKEAYEIYKLEAEIRQIRSDTAGSLYWLKLAALFITLGGVVGGYLVTQSANTRKRLRFELRKNINDSFQMIVQELSAESPILRAASAVKLGGILEHFPEEWVQDEGVQQPTQRREELIQLTRQILAAALAIEQNEKVLKTITIALTGMPKREDGRTQMADLSKLDLSRANAADAYWAGIAFHSADFFRANLSQASFRKADLTYAQFYKSNLSDAVLSNANCINTNFKFADLRRADLRGAKIDKSTNFEAAKVYGIKLNTDLALLSDAQVDVSKNGDGSSMTSLLLWLRNPVPDD